MNTPKNNISKYFTLFLFLLFFNAFAQDGSYSPYSYFRFGDPVDKQPVQFASMGHLDFFADSIHYNPNNPAAVAHLKYVNYAFAFSSETFSIKSNEDAVKQTAMIIPYVYLGFPIGKKAGVGTGFRPYATSNFLIKIDRPGEQIAKTGEGGLNEFFTTAGLKLYKGLSAGIGFHYYFGNKIYRIINYRDNVYTITRQIDNAFYTGRGFDFSLMYKQKINQLQFQISAGYQPDTHIKSENVSTLELIDNSYNIERISDKTVLRHDTTTQVLPARFNFGMGIGSKGKWFAGLQYEHQDWTSYQNDFFTNSAVQYGHAYEFRLGGYWIPDNRIHVKYWKRITYKAGFFSGATGLILHDKPVNYFGTTFGMDLPVKHFLSHASIDFEYWKRGSMENGLVLENIFKFKISLSLNDKWFVKRKIN